MEHAAVGADDLAGLGEQGEIAAEGGVGDAEAPAEGGDRKAAMAPDGGEDLLVAFVSEHDEIG